MNKYYSLAQEGREATINVYGDITSWPWLESDVSAYNLSREIEELDVDVINVYINSYGGEVAEGLAIYNSLKRHNAKVVTVDDGFACSIASVIFMAGDERKMSDASLLMIHNAWTYASGNAEELRKAAEDLDKITSASVAAYMTNVTITEEEVKQLMDDETWLTPQECIEKGFATEILTGGTDKKASQSVRKSIFNTLTGRQKEPEPKPQSGSQPEPMEPEMQVKEFVKALFA